MKQRLLLRIAAVLILLQLLGHTYGHIIWDKRPEDPRMQEVLDAMKGYKGEFMGATKSMADYYTGYSLMIFFLYIMTIAILWMLSTRINDDKGLVRKILYPIGFTYLAVGVILYLHFFLFAASLSFMAGIMILISARVAKRDSPT
jgi:hypothetical protein